MVQSGEGETEKREHNMVLGLRREGRKDGNAGEEKKIKKRCRGESEIAGQLFEVAQMILLYCVHQLAWLHKLMAHMGQ